VFISDKANSLQLFSAEKGESTGVKLFFLIHMLFGGGDLKQSARRMPAEPMRGSCRMQRHRERSRDGIQLGPEARTACGLCRSFAKSLVADAANRHAELPLGFVSPGKPLLRPRACSHPSYLNALSGSPCELSRALGGGVLTAYQLTAAFPWLGLFEGFDG